MIYIITPQGFVITIFILLLLFIGLGVKFINILRFSLTILFIFCLLSGLIESILTAIRCKKKESKIYQMFVCFIIELCLSCSLSYIIYNYFFSISSSVLLAKGIVGALMELFDFALLFVIGAVCTLFLFLWYKKELKIVYNTQITNRFWFNQYLKNRISLFLVIVVIGIIEMLLGYFVSIYSIKYQLLFSINEIFGKL